MKKVCVITGGGSGMGLAAAKIIGKDHFVFIAGRSVKKLENAIAGLHAEGVEAEAVPCDILDRGSVEKLARRAKEKGTVASVIHSAGMSPSMGDAHNIMEVNALGTININEAFYEVMEAGSCIIDIASMSAYLFPEMLLPKRAFQYSRTSQAVFMKKMMARVNLFPRKVRPGVSYAISKNFVIWYAKTDAGKFGRKGIRVLSVSPGFFDTAMGNLEKDDAEKFLEYSALNRLGKVEEIGSLLAFCASDRPGYLTGTDILCDGGCIAGQRK